MTKKNYSEFWDKESSQFNTDGVYARLSEIAPAHSTLEVGCGAGWSTLSLARNRAVLAVDNNTDLINIAKLRLDAEGVSVNIIESDIFEPSDELVEAIKSFEPRVITGWFIGSNPDDNDKRTSATLSAAEKPKEYREKFEDRLVTLPLCVSSVDWIHTVQRAGVPPGINDSQVIDEIIKEYEKYMFKDSEFEVVDVQVIDWNQHSSSFPYVEMTRPDLPTGEPRATILSILAQRR